MSAPVIAHYIGAFLLFAITVEAPTWLSVSTLIFSGVLYVWVPKTIRAGLAEVREEITTIDDER